MQAQDGRIYAQIIDGRFHWQFTQADLPEWADDAFGVVDITDMSPMPTVGLEYIDAAFVFPPSPIPDTAAQVFSKAQIDYTNHVQTFIIQKARDKGYRDDIACVGYLSDPYPPFSADASSFIAWRSQVWQRCYSDLEFIKAGTMAMPESPEAYLATLPQSPVGW